MKKVIGAKYELLTVGVGENKQPAAEVHLVVEEPYYRPVHDPEFDGEIERHNRHSWFAFVNTANQLEAVGKQLIAIAADARRKLGQ